MTYDMRGGFQILTGHHTNLYTPTGDLYRISAERSLVMYEAAGVPRTKMLLGSAFYSRVWREVPDRNDGLFQMSPGPGKSGPGFAELAAQYIDKNGFVRHWDEEAKAPYLFDGSTFISYDDEESIGHKCRFILDAGFGGLFYWEHGCDPTRTLLTSIRRGLY
jgi:chitinase